MEARSEGLGAIVLRALRGIWNVACWPVHHGGWVLWTLVVALAGWRLECPALMLTGMVLLVVPAVVDGVWSVVNPGSHERLIAGPERRAGRRRWIRRNWTTIARECGLSVQRPNWRGESVWVGPRLRGVTTSGESIMLRVRARTGQTSSDIAAALSELASALDAVSARSIARSPSTLDMTFVMSDPLVGTRLAEPVARDAAVTVGRIEDGSDLVVDFGAAWHLALQGQTRSGKSVLMYAMLSGLAGVPEVRVCGLDPTGILLGPWAGSPGDEFRHLGTADIENTGDVMARIVAEMDERIAGLMEAGIDKLANPTAETPLMLVVLEEYPGMLSAAEADDAMAGRKPAERVASRIKAGVRRLIQEGAKAGYRVMLLAQRMDAAIVGGAERSNLGTRITLRVEGGEAVRMLHSDVSGDMIRELSAADPGKGVIDTPGYPLRWFKADLFTYEEYSAHVRAAYQMASTFPEGPMFETEDLS